MVDMLMVRHSAVSVARQYFVVTEQATAFWTASLFQSESMRTMTSTKFFLELSLFLSIVQNSSLGSILENRQEYDQPR